MEKVFSLPKIINQSNPYRVEFEDLSLKELVENAPFPQVSYKLSHTNAELDMYILQDNRYKSYSSHVFCHKIKISCY